MLNHKFFREVGTQIREAYRTHIFTKALDVNDKPFSSKYSEPYGSLKKAGKLPRQKKGKINSPKVSWGLLIDYGTVYKTSATGFEMGWSSKGEVVESLNKRGRLLSTKEQALPKAVAKLLEVETDKFINKEGLGGDTITRHRIG